MGKFAHETRSENDGFSGLFRAQPGPPEGRQGASRGPRGVENWGRFLVHPYARRTSSRDPYHQVGGTPRGCRIDNCFLRFRTVAKLLRVLGASSYLVWLAGCLPVLYKPQRVASALLTRLFHAFPNPFETQFGAPGAPGPFLERPK